MASQRDLAHLPAHRQHRVVEAARAARRVALASAVTADRAERQADALAEAQSAAARIAEAGGLRALDHRTYEAEKQAMLARLRRAR